MLTTGSVMFLVALVFSLLYMTVVSGTTDGLPMSGGAAAPNGSGITIGSHSRKGPRKKRGRGIGRGKGKQRKAKESHNIGATSVPQPPNQERPHAPKRAEYVSKFTPFEERPHTAQTSAPEEGPVLKPEAERDAIAFYFLNALDAPPRGEWKGHGGTITIIVRELNLPTGSRDRVWKVLEKVQYCAENNLVYDPSRESGQGGQNKMIKTAEEHQIIADHYERGEGLEMTWRAVNDYRESLVPPLIHCGLSSVQCAMHRLAPLVEPDRLHEARQPGQGVELGRVPKGLVLAAARSLRNSLRRAGAAD
jgi:hypothetical protein